MRVTIVCLLLSYYKELEQQCLVPCKGNQDSLEVWISPHGLRISGTGFQSFSVEIGFWIPIFSGIPEFFCVCFCVCVCVFFLLYFGFQRPDFWIPESLTLGEMTATVGEAKIATGALTKKTHLRTCINPFCTPLCRH